METKLRKIGNSKGVVLPSHVLKELNIQIDDHLSVDNVNGKIELSLVRKKYSLEELVAKCDMTAPMPQELIDWENSESVGNEA